MSELFLEIVNRSIAASWIVIAVLILRFCLKKAPKWVNVLLWGIVAVRLIFPFSIESALSLIPSAETVSPSIMMETAPSVQTGVPALDQVINPVIDHSLAPAPGASANPLQIWIPVLTVIWLWGVAALFLYSAVSYRRLRRRVCEAVILRDNIYQSENVCSPFVLGIIRPKIYLPYHMDKREMDHVIAHEQTHIRRRDHWWKPLGFLLLTVHWFNPLLWLGYILLCRDMEYACDEAVLRDLEEPDKRAYSQALLNCAGPRRAVTACPVAFGEICVKGPILALGYYNSREKTAESFLQNPLNRAYDERIYKTGDLGHFAPDGNLMFHGRKDRQVKHLGHRVELGEIDLAAAKVPGVEEACALYDQEHEQIWLFYTGADVTKRDIAVALRADLPGFMVPRKIEQLDAMPRLDNGKTDMRALAGRIADAHR